MASRSRHVPLTGSPHGPCGGERRTPLCAVCVRVARRAHAGCSGGPDVRQALQRSPMPAHTCSGRPIADGDCACREPCLPARRRLARHVTVPATLVDQVVHLPALIGPRPCLERLLDRRTLAVCQVPGRLPLARPLGSLLGGCGGIVRAHRHPLPAAPGGFPLDTCCIEAWASHPDVLRQAFCVTIGDVMPRRGCWRCPAHVVRAAGRRSASPSRRRGAVAVVVARPCGGQPASRAIRVSHAHGACLRTEEERHGLRRTDEEALRLPKARRAIGRGEPLGGDKRHGRPEARRPQRGEPPACGQAGRNRWRAASGRGRGTGRGPAGRRGHERGRRGRPHGPQGGRGVGERPRPR